MATLRENYDSLLKSGMFWEFHPHLTGEWERDKEWFTYWYNGDDIDEKYSLYASDCLIHNGKLPFEPNCDIFEYSHFKKR